MKRKINCILLIDDDEPTNVSNRLIIEEEECSKHIIEVLGGQEGLDYIKSCNGKDRPFPDLILLDINMPAMNGWEFMLEFEKLDVQCKDQIKIVMLTTAVNPNDKMHSSKNFKIDDFMHKPLTNEMICDILQRHFSSD